MLFISFYTENARVACNKSVWKILNVWNLNCVDTNLLVDIDTKAVSWHSKGRETSNDDGPNIDPDLCLPTLSL